MANTFNLGNGNWAQKTEKLLAYNAENDNYKPLPFDFDRASTATRVNKQGLIETVGVDKPRIDFLNNSKGHLLLEPQRTNLITYSEDFSQWATEANIEITDNSITSPDGTQNAAKLQLTGSSSGTDGKISINVSPSATTHTFSIFAKKGNHDYIYIWMTMSVGGNITRWIDLNDGSVSVGSGTATVTTTSFSNDWWKIEYTFDATYLSSIKLEVADDVVSTGTGGDNIYVFGAQFEQGYLTSYIPTQGSAVTRSAETCNNAGNSTVFNDSEGVLYLEGSALADDGVDKRIFLSDGTMNNYVAIGYSRFAGNIIAEMVSGGVLQTVNWGATGINKTNNNKFALSWGSGTMKFYVNGTQTNTESVTSPTGLNVLEFNTAVDTLVMYSNTRDLRVYNTALTDAELIALTT